MKAMEHDPQDIDSFIAALEQIEDVQGMDPPISYEQFSELDPSHFERFEHTYENAKSENPGSAREQLIVHLREEPARTLFSIRNT